MPDTKKADYIFIWGNTQGVLTLDGDTMALRDYTENIWNSISRMIHISRDNKISCYLSLADVNHNIELGKLWFDPAYPEKFLQEVATVCEKHRALFARLKKTQFNKLSKKELCDHLVEVVNQYAETIGYFRGSQMAATQQLADEVLKHITSSEAAILLLPSKLDPINYEQIDWQELIKQLYDKKKMLAHVEKYPWIVPYHFTLDDVHHTLLERFTHDVVHLKPHDIAAEKEELKTRQVALLKKYPAIKKQVELLNQIALSRIELKSCWAGNDFYVLPLFAEIAWRGGESPEDIIKYYLLDDVSALLAGKQLTEEKKQDRKRCTAFFWEDGQRKIFFGAAAEALEKTELGALVKTEGIKELKGVSANHGFFKGVVKILESNDSAKARDFRTSFLQGEILVTQMTQPNIMDIVKKAGAIITDEGGMLSHAAIFSREFKIPCVVGTRNATKVLKDGDIVEVDADKGIVKIIA